MQGSSPEGVNDVCFYTFKKFSLPSPTPGSQGKLNLPGFSRIWQNLVKSGRIWQNLAEIDRGGKKKNEEEEKRKKIPHMCESIGH